MKTLLILILLLGLTGIAQAAQPYQPKYKVIPNCPMSPEKQREFIKDMRDCAEEIRATKDPSFTAHYNPDDCRVSLSMQSQGLDWVMAFDTFKACLREVGWIEGTDFGWR
jgi:hypothetical protein